MIPADTPLWMWCAAVTGLVCWALWPVLIGLVVWSGRRERRHTRAALRLERELLDRLTAPDRPLPPDTLAAGRAALHAAVTTPDPDTLRDLVGPVDWPEQEDQ